MTGTTPDSTAGSDDRSQCSDRESTARITDTSSYRLVTDRVDRFRRWALVTGFALVVSIQAFAGTAAAQSTVGSSLCGTPIANFINSAAPLVVALAMIVGTVFAYLMHSRAGLARDAEQAQFYLDWRNRAGYTAVTAPLLAFILEMMIGFTGTGVAACIDLVPFF